MPLPASIQPLILAWFAQSGRDLPWRRTHDPYAILVSEVMLQQTQVERVIPKYDAFLSAFPTLADLAAASTAEVIRHWAGLGYNRRAVNLQRASQMVCHTYGGVFPRNVAELRTLPGVGAYTAGAVACFAFCQDVTFMDTNIRRVLRRSAYGPDHLEVTPPDREILAHGERLLPPGQGWAWNQALIDLGALICTATLPACSTCPIKTLCQAYATEPHPQPLRRVAERKTVPYQGSRRWQRGRIVAALRQHTALAFNQLGPLVKPDYTASDAVWLHDLVAGLVRDGLVVVADDTVQLPA